MRTGARFSLAVLLTLSIAPSATGSSEGDQNLLESELRVERSLLDLDLDDHGQLRRREKAYRNQILGIEKMIDEMLQQERIALEELEILDDTLSAARRAAHGVANRTDELRRRIYDRWRRIALLDIELEKISDPPQRLRDPVSGEWRVQILPAGFTGTFRLELNGTLVQGTYDLAGGSWGSLRGTFVGKTLRLERVDARHGFDLVLEGTISDDRQRIDGTWVATLLTGGGPGNGHWSIQRADRGTEESE